MDTAPVKRAGLTDLTVVTYPDARHEIFSETTRAEITTAMLDWLRTHHLATT
jgi:alpha-beta hydrolase superfamily lysophospholipase